MALAKQVITLDFGFGGIDQKSDPKLIVRTRLAELYDARFNKAGRVDRRNGQALFGTPSAKGVRLLNNDGQLLMVSGAFDATPPYVFRTDSNGSITRAQTYPAVMPAAEITVEAIGPVRRTTPAPPTMLVDRADGDSMYTIATQGVNSSGSNIVNVEIRDTATNALLQSLTSLVAYSPKLIANPIGGNHWMMLSASSSSLGATMQLHTFSATSGLEEVTSPSFGVCRGASLVSMIDSNTAHYITPGVPTGRIWLARIKSVTELTLTSHDFPRATFGSSLSTYSTINVTGVTIVGVGLLVPNNPSATVWPTSYDGRSVRMAWHDIGANRGAYSGYYGESNTTIVAPVLVSSATAVPAYNIVGSEYEYGGAPVAVVGLGFAQGSITASTEIYELNASHTPTLIDTICGMDIASNWRGPASQFEAAHITRAAYGWFAYRSDTTQQCALLMRIENEGGTRAARVAGRVFYGYGPSPVQITASFGAPTVQYLGGGNFVTPLTSKQRVANSADGEGDIYDVYAVRHTSATTGKGWDATGVRNELLITGGHATFIGAAEGPVPLGPLLAPNIISVSGTSSGGGVALGTYAVSGILEYTDASGRIHRSAPALPRTVTLSGTHVAMVVNYEAYRVPDGLAVSGRLRFVPYRTLVNESQVYYRTASTTAVGVAPSTTSTYNVNLTVADATIGVQPTLYTVGSVFPDYTPSAPIAIASNGRRCLCVEGDNPTFVLEGKPIVNGYGASFMQGVGKYVAAGGARIYALASYLDKWFAFKEHGIFVAQGDGADVTGQNDTLSEFQPLVSRFGCTSPRSVVTTANGIVFASVKGFYMIGADLGAQYIGASVEDYTSAVIDAAYDELNDTVYYLLADGTHLVLTFFTTEAGVEPRWSVDQNSGGSSVQVINGLRYLLPTSTTTETKSVYRETAGTYIDRNISTTQVPAFKATSAWVPMGGIQGFGRVYKALVIGTFPAAQAATTVLVRIGFNYSSTYAESHTILSTAMIANGNNVQFEIRPATQKCEAIRFEISQPETTVAGAGLALNQIQLTVGIKSGDNKIAATARAVGS